MHALEGSNWRVGQTVKAKGYFTVFRELAGKTGRQIEGLVGFRPGRLEDGWALLASIFPPVPSAFELHGTTTFSGGLVAGVRYEDNVQKHGNTAVQDQRVIWYQRFLRERDWRAVKVVAATPCDVYPPGAGIPQFYLTGLREFVVVGLFSRDEICPRSLASQL